MPPALTRQQDRAGAQAAGLRLTKRHGQHLLRDQGIINRIVAHAELRPSDTVLEIGPGMGALTFALVPNCRKVIACEIDPMMIVELQKRVNTNDLARERLTIVNGDFLAMKVPRFDCCVANCPYNVSSAIVLKLLTLHQVQPWRRSVLMFQLEFAQRMAAQPGSEHWSRLSATTQLLAKCQLIIKVGRNSFNPPPKVESAVVMLEPRNPAPQVSLTEFDGLCKIIFNRKNRTVVSLFHEGATLRALEIQWRLLHGLPMPTMPENDDDNDENMDDDDVDYNDDEPEDEPAPAPAPASLAASLLGGAAPAAPARAARPARGRAARKGPLPTAEFRELVDEVLLHSGVMGGENTRGALRAQQMSSVDILALLNEFLAKGIHFMNANIGGDDE